VIEGVHQVKTTVSLPEHVHRAVRHLSIEEGLTVQALMAQAVIEYLAKREEKIAKFKERSR
jgi:hypothetical protein